MNIKMLSFLIFAMVLNGAIAKTEQDRIEMTEKSPYVIVLGIAQDGGVPHVGVKEHKGWEDLHYRRYASCLGVIDPVSEQRWMFDATPDFRTQLYRLDKLFPTEKRPRLDGIFLTHAHIGHYTGLMFLGHESLGAREIPVYAMPRMYKFLENNGPWNQLVRYKNIILKPLDNGISIQLNDRLTITPFLVPHRQEFSEVAGFRISGPNRSVLYIPDIDRWEDWDSQGTKIESMINKVDIAYLDGTFYADDEIPGRDMSTIPHPLIEKSMKRFSSLPFETRQKIRFIHLNHTNPALWKESEARKTITENGFRVAEELEKINL